MRGKRRRTLGRIPDEAVLVRGAPMRSDDLLTSALDCATSPVGGFFGLSVFTAPGRPAWEVFERSPLRRPEICEAVAEKVRETGVEIIWTDDRIEGHASLIFCHEPTDRDIQRVMEAFSPARQK